MGTILRLDADDFTDEKIALAYVEHPDAPIAFRRSTLVIGSRGAGKTFLLRHRARHAHPGAVYLKLTSVLSSIPRNSGIGAHADHLSREVEEQLQAKTAALIAANVLLACVKDRKESAPSMTILSGLLPAVLRSSGEATREVLQDTIGSAAAQELSLWQAGVELRNLQDFFSAINDHYGKGFALFLDGAESASYPSVRVLYQLLDQSVPVLTVVAARPGMAQLIERLPDASLMPGDHFEILHLGTDPYGDRWQGFSRTVVQSTLDAFNVSRPQSLELAWASALARDSLRQAVQFAEHGYQTVNDLNRRAQLIDLVRQDRLARARSIMSSWNPNFSKLLDTIRAQYWQKATPGRQDYLVLGVKDLAPQLFPGTARDTVGDFFTAGLLCEVFFYPPRTQWSAFEIPTAVEINPLLIWDESRREWIE